MYFTPTINQYRLQIIDMYLVVNETHTTVRYYRYLNINKANFQSFKLLQLNQLNCT